MHGTAPGCSTGRHAPTDRWDPDRPRHQVDRPRRGPGASPGSWPPSRPSSPTVQNNEASSWLPESAESTQVLEELSETVDPNDIPTLVVYHRDGGLTEDDLAAIEADGPEIAELDGVTDEGVLTPAAAEAAAAQGAPVPTLVSEDGEVAYLYFVLNFGANGWNAIPDAADEIRDIATLDGGEVHLAGFGGQAADSAEAFEGIDTNLIFATLAVVIVILLFTYRSPILWLLPILCAVVGQLHRDRPGLPPREVRRPHGQRPEPGHPQHPGDRSRHRLRVAARRPLPGGAPSSRGPPRGDGVRAAPRRAGDLRQRGHRRRRHAVPVVRRPQLHRRPRPGPRHRRRRHHARDGDPAAGPAGDLRPLGLLAQAPRLPQRRAHRRRLLGPRRSLDQPPPASGLGRDHRPAAAGLPRSLPARRVRAVDRGHLHEGVRLHQGPEAARRRTAWPTTPTRSRSSPTPTRQPRSSRRWRTSRASAPRARSSRSPTTGCGSRRPSTPTSPPPPRPTSSRQPRGRPRGRRVPTRSSEAVPRSTSTPRSPPSATAGSSCRWSWPWCC